MTRPTTDFLVPLGGTDEQAMMADVIDDLNEVHALADDPDVRDVWATLVELGVHAALLDDGDDALSRDDLTVIAQKLGEGLNAETFLWGAIVAPSLLLACESSSASAAGRADAIARVASGTLATVAMHDASGDLAAVGAGMTVGGSDEAATITGTAAFVPYRNAADLLLVVGHRDGAPVLVEVLDRDAAAWTDREAFDLRIPLADLSLSDAACRVLGSLPADLAPVLSLALLLQAAAVTGSAERALADAVEYSRVREQFGAPIAQFQAIRHRLAETLVELELMRATLRRAARTDDLATGMLAAYHCLSSAALVARANIQVHGGIGYTWEHTAHRHYRYAFAARHALCSLESLERSLMDTVIADGGR